MPAVSVAVTPAALSIAFGAIGQAASSRAAVTAAGATVSAVGPTRMAQIAVATTPPLDRTSWMRPISPIPMRANVVPQTSAVTPIGAALSPIGPTAAPRIARAVTPANATIGAATPTVSV